MGYVPQEGGLLEFLTVTQTLELFHGLHSIKSHHTSHSTCCWSVLPNMTNQIVDKIDDINTSHSNDNNGISHISHNDNRSRSDKNRNGGAHDHLIEKDHSGIGTDSSPLPSPHHLHTDSTSHPWGDLIGSSLKSILPSKYSHYRVHTLSGGNRKKLSVAISNINDPAFLAMDECTSGQ